MAPLAAAIRSMCDLGAPAYSQLESAVCWFLLGGGGGGETGEPGEKPSKQRREPTQTQPTYGVWSVNRTSATLVGGECSHNLRSGPFLASLICSLMSSLAKIGPDQKSLKNSVWSAKFWPTKLVI